MNDPDIVTPAGEDKSKVALSIAQQRVKQSDNNRRALNMAKAYPNASALTEFLRANKELQLLKASKKNPLIDAERRKIGKQLYDTRSDESKFWTLTTNAFLEGKTLKEISEDENILNEWNKLASEEQYYIATARNGVGLLVPKKDKDGNPVTLTEASDRGFPSTFKIKDSENFSNKIDGHFDVYDPSTDTIIAAASINPQEIVDTSKIVPQGPPINEEGEQAPLRQSTNVEITMPFPDNDELVDKNVFNEHFKNKYALLNPEDQSLIESLTSYKDVDTDATPFANPTNAQARFLELYLRRIPIPKDKNGNPDSTIVVRPLSEEEKQVSDWLNELPENWDPNRRYTAQRQHNTLIEEFTDIWTVYKNLENKAGAGANPNTLIDEALEQLNMRPTINALHPASNMPVPPSDRVLPAPPAQIEVVPKPDMGSDWEYTTLPEGFTIPPVVENPPNNEPLTEVEEAVLTELMGLARYRRLEAKNARSDERYKAFNLSRRHIAPTEAQIRAGQPNARVAQCYELLQNIKKFHPDYNLSEVELYPILQKLQDKGYAKFKKGKTADYWQLERGATKPAGTGTWAQEPWYKKASKFLYRTDSAGNSIGLIRAAYTHRGGSVDRNTIVDVENNTTESASASVPMSTLTRQSYIKLPDNTYGKVISSYLNEQDKVLPIDETSNPLQDVAFPEDMIVEAGQQLPEIKAHKFIYSDALTAQPIEHILYQNENGTYGHGAFVRDTDTDSYLPLHDNDGDTGINQGAGYAEFTTALDDFNTSLDTVTSRHGLIQDENKLALRDTALSNLRSTLQQDNPSFFDRDTLRNIHINLSLGDYKLLNDAILHPDANSPIPNFIAPNTLEKWNISALWNKKQAGIDKELENYSNLDENIQGVPLHAPMHSRNVGTGATPSSPSEGVKPDIEVRQDTDIAEVLNKLYLTDFLNLKSGNLPINEEEEAAREALGKETYAQLNERIKEEKNRYNKQAIVQEFLDDKYGMNISKFLTTLADLVENDTSPQQQSAKFLHWLETSLKFFQVNAPKELTEGLPETLTGETLSEHISNKVSKDNVYIVPEESPLNWNRSVNITPFETPFTTKEADIVRNEAQTKDREDEIQRARAQRRNVSSGLPEDLSKIQAEYEQKGVIPTGQGNAYKAKILHSQTQGSTEETLNPSEEALAFLKELNNATIAIRNNADLTPEGKLAEFKRQMEEGVTSDNIPYSKAYNALLPRDRAYFLTMGTDAKGYIPTVVAPENLPLDYRDEAMPWLMPYTQIFPSFRPRSFFEKEVERERLSFDTNGELVVVEGREAEDTEADIDRATRLISDHLENLQGWEEFKQAVDTMNQDQESKSTIIISGDGITNAYVGKPISDLTIELHNVDDDNITQYDLSELANKIPNVNIKLNAPEFGYKGIETSAFTTKFTHNALLFNVSNSSILDPLNRALNDIDANVLERNPAYYDVGLQRNVNDFGDILQSENLYEIANIASQYNLELSESLENLKFNIKDNSEDSSIFEGIPISESKQNFLLDMLGSGNADKGLDYLKRAGVFSTDFPYLDKIPDSLWNVSLDYIKKIPTDASLAHKIGHFMLSLPNEQTIKDPQYENPEELPTALPYERVDRSSLFRDSMIKDGFDSPKIPMDAQKRDKVGEYYGRVFYDTIALSNPQWANNTEEIRSLVLNNPPDRLLNYLKTATDLGLINIGSSRARYNQINKYDKYLKELGIERSSIGNYSFRNSLILEEDIRNSLLMTDTDLNLDKTPASPLLKENQPIVKDVRDIIERDLNATLSQLIIENRLHTKDEILDYVENKYNKVLSTLKHNGKSLTTLSLQDNYPIDKDTILSQIVTDYKKPEVKATDIIKDGNQSSSDLASIIRETLAKHPREKSETEEGKKEYTIPEGLRLRTTRDQFERLIELDPYTARNIAEEFKNSAWDHRTSFLEHWDISTIGQITKRIGSVPENIENVIPSTNEFDGYDTHESVTYDEDKLLDFRNHPKFEIDKTASRQEKYRAKQRSYFQPREQALVALREAIHFGMQRVGKPTRNLYPDDKNVTEGYSAEAPPRYPAEYFRIGNIIDQLTDSELKEVLDTSNLNWAKGIKTQRYNADWALQPSRTIENEDGERITASKYHQDRYNSSQMSLKMVNRAVRDYQSNPPVSYAPEQTSFDDNNNVISQTLEEHLQTNSATQRYYQTSIGEDDFVTVLNQIGKQTLAQGIAANEATEKFKEFEKTEADTRQAISESLSNFLAENPNEDEWDDTTKADHYSLVSASEAIDYTRKQLRDDIQETRGVRYEDTDEFKKQISKFSLEQLQRIVNANPDNTNIGKVKSALSSAKTAIQKVTKEFNNTHNTSQTIATNSRREGPIDSTLGGSVTKTNVKDVMKTLRELMKEGSDGELKDGNYERLMGILRDLSIDEQSIILLNGGMDNNELDRFNKFLNQANEKVSDDVDSEFIYNLSEALSLFEQDTSKDEAEQNQTLQDILNRLANEDLQTQFLNSLVNTEAITPTNANTLENGGAKVTTARAATQLAEAVNAEPKRDFSTLAYNYDDSHPEGFKESALMKRLFARGWSKDASNRIQYPYGTQRKANHPPGLLYEASQNEDLMVAVRGLASAIPGTDEEGSVGTDELASRILFQAYIDSARDRHNQSPTLASVLDRVLYYKTNTFKPFIDEETASNFNDAFHRITKDTLIYTTRRRMLEHKVKDVFGEKATVTPNASGNNISEQLGYDETKDFNASDFNKLETLVNTIHEAHVSGKRAELLNQIKTSNLYSEEELKTLDFTSPASLEKEYNTRLTKQGGNRTPVDSRYKSADPSPDGKLPNVGISHGNALINNGQFNNSNAQVLLNTPRYFNILKDVAREYHKHLTEDQIATSGRKNRAREDHLEDFAKLIVRQAYDTVRNNNLKEWKTEEGKRRQNVYNPTVEELMSEINHHIKRSNIDRALHPSEDKQTETQVLTNASIKKDTATLRKLGIAMRPYTKTKKDSEGNPIINPETGERETEVVDRRDPEYVKILNISNPSERATALKKFTNQKEQDVEAFQNSEFQTNLKTYLSDHKDYDKFKQGKNISYKEVNTLLQNAMKQKSAQNKYSAANTKEFARKDAEILLEIPIDPDISSEDATEEYKAIHELIGQHNEHLTSSQLKKLRERANTLKTDYNAYTTHIDDAIQRHREIEDRHEEWRRNNLTASPDEVAAQRALTPKYIGSPEYHARLEEEGPIGTHAQRAQEHHETSTAERQQQESLNAEDIYTNGEEHRSSRASAAKHGGYNKFIKVGTDGKATHSVLMGDNGKSITVKEGSGRSEAHHDDYEEFGHPEAKNKYNAENKDSRPDNIGYHPQIASDRLSTAAANQYARALKMKADNDPDSSAHQEAQRVIDAVTEDHPEVVDVFKDMKTKGTHLDSKSAQEEERIARGVAPSAAPVSKQTGEVLVWAPGIGHWVLPKTFQQLASDPKYQQGLLMKQQDFLNHFQGELLKDEDTGEYLDAKGNAIPNFNPITDKSHKGDIYFHGNSGQLMGVNRNSDGQTSLDNNAALSAGLGKAINSHIGKDTEAAPLTRNRNNTFSGGTQIPDSATEGVGHLDHMNERVSNLQQKAGKKSFSGRLNDIGNRYIESSLVDAANTPQSPLGAVVRTGARLGIVDKITSIAEKFKIA